MIRLIDICHTFSIVARDSETGALGVAVQTHQIGVGRLVPFLVPGVGAIATQSLVNVSFGPMGLAMLRQGVAADKVIAALVASDEGEARRQVACVDADGNAAAHTGTGCIPHAGHHVGDGYSVQANMMTNDTVVDAMRDAYENTAGDLSARMMAALFAAQEQDGDIRGMQSAALKIVPGDPSLPGWTTLYDLRVDEHERPLDELARLVKLQRAHHINGEGYALLDSGDLAGTLEKWSQARQIAPGNEETGFWQAVSLADRKPTDDSVRTAAAIFNEAMAGEGRRQHWIDLIGRLQDVGLIERDGAGDELIQAIG